MPVPPWRTSRSTAAPSAGFAVIRGNDTLAYGAHGLANVEAWRAPTATTIYEIGSNTKQFTSAAMMKLVEQGGVKTCARD